MGRLYGPSAHGFQRCLKSTLCAHSPLCFSQVPLWKVCCLQSLLRTVGFPTQAKPRPPQGTSHLPSLEKVHHICIHTVFLLLGHCTQRLSIWSASCCVWAQLSFSLSQQRQLHLQVSKTETQTVKSQSVLLVGELDDNLTEVCQSRNDREKKWCSM